MLTLLSVGITKSNLMLCDKLDLRRLKERHSNSKEYKNTKTLDVVFGLVLCLME